MTMRNGDEELGWKGSFLLGCGIGVVVLLLVGLVVVWSGSKVERAKHDVTWHSLNRLRNVAVTQRTPSADGTGSDWTGQAALGRISLEMDGWGNPIRYRCPGPVHKKGWDLWSCGPNGKDDQGTFDDILLGEDVAPESSR